MKRRHTVTVIYKNGAKVRFRAKEFSVTQYANGNREVSWEGPGRVKPIMFGIGDVAAIYEGRI